MEEFMKQDPEHVISEQCEIEVDPPERKKQIILLGSALLLGILFNWLFYEKDIGISYLIFVFGLYAMLFINAKDSISYKPGFGWFLSIPIVLLSVTYFIRTDMFFLLLDFLAIPVLIIAQSIIITQRNKNEWFSFGFIIDLFYSMTVRIFANLFKPFKAAACILPGKALLGMNTKAFKILIGLLISVPLVVIILPLLASADEVFGKLLDSITNLFDDIRIGELIVRFFIIAVVSSVSFSYLWSLTRPNKFMQEYPRFESGKLPKVFDPITVITILAVVNFIYIVFVAIQFTYLFGGISFALSSDFTFSEYARRGFFELVAVTLINFTILILTLTFTRGHDKTSDRTVRILHTLLVSCTMVMLISAHFRMSLYEEAYGYTHLRVLTHSFMVFLFVLFGITLYRIWNDRIRLAKPYIVTALIAFVIINYMNVDVIIARNNIERYQKTNKIDITYLVNLSDNAIPELMKLVNSEDKDIAKAVRNELVRRKASLEAVRPWQSFNMARWQAKKALEGL